MRVCVSDANSVPGPAPMAHEFDDDAGVMKKCTLCVDRIYNQNLPEADRVPACVSTCPASARHFGDFADPNSDVSKLTATRGGYD